MPKAFFSLCLCRSRSLITRWILPVVCLALFVFIIVQKYYSENKFTKFWSLYKLPVQRYRPSFSLNSSNKLIGSLEKTYGRDSDQRGDNLQHNQELEFRNLTSDEEAELRNTFFRRKDHIRRACETALYKYELDVPLISEEFLVNHKYKLLWCSVFKSASTTWMFHFLKMLHLSDTNIEKMRAGGKSYSQVARQFYDRFKKEKLLEVAKNKTYTSFLIVRDPMERLVSAYRNKIENKRDLYLKPLRCKITAFFSRRKKQLYKCQPTFSEFVSFVIDEHERKATPNVHWTPASEFCAPCMVKYDYVLHFENLPQEESYFVNQIKGLSKILKRREMHSSRTNYSAIYDKYFDQLDNTQMKSLLYDVYKNDFHLFKYNQTFYHKWFKKSNITR